MAADIVAEQTRWRVPTAQVEWMKPMDVQDVLALLRGEIARAGGQSEWARQTNITTPLINRVLNGRRLPPTQLCRALGLEWVAVRHVTSRDDQTKSVIISKREVLQILREEIERSGGITAWSRQIGVNRTYLSLVVHKRKAPGKTILAALKLSEALVRAGGTDVALKKRRLRNGKQPHARW
jgi:DNA-binding phage protein